MSQPMNYLRTFRKRSRLTQADIAFLMGLADYSNLSRCETGERTPSLDMILAYHLLFDAPIEVFFKRHKATLRLDMEKRVQELLRELKEKDAVPNVAERIAFLESVFTKFKNSPKMYEPEQREEQPRLPFPVS